MDNRDVREPQRDPELAEQEATVGFLVRGFYLRIQTQTPGDSVLVAGDPLDGEGLSTWIRFGEQQTAKTVKVDVTSAQGETSTYRFRVKRKGNVKVSKYTPRDVTP